MTDKKPVKISLRVVILILTAILVGYVVYQNWPDILNTLNHLQDADVFILLLLIPEQLFMYFACGQIFFSYLHAQKNVEKFSNKEILRISTELNFVNRAIPVGGIGGLAFLTYRLRPHGVSAGQTSFLYVFRYAVTTVINYLQALVAIIVLLGLNMILDETKWIIPVALLMNFGVLLFLSFVIYVASTEKRIEKFAKIIEKIANFGGKILTFGRKKQVIRHEKIERYFEDIHVSVKTAKKNKKFLTKPMIWGVIYSFCEIGAYWLVAISLGRPELLPIILISEAIGSVFDGIIPYGLYELGMAGTMIALGVDFATATIVTVMTRIITLLFTILSGSLPYYLAIKGKKNERSA